MISKTGEIIGKSRYYLDGESWKDCALRSAEGNAAGKPNYTHYRDKFYEMIFEMYALPGGRILRNT